MELILSVVLDLSLRCASHTYRLDVSPCVADLKWRLDKIRCSFLWALFDRFLQKQVLSNPHVASFFFFFATTAEEVNIPELINMATCSLSGRASWLGRTVVPVT